MGTTCSCFRETPCEELVVINRENNFIQSKGMPELSEEINPLFDTSSDIYLKTIIKLQGIFRGFIDRNKIKPLLTSKSTNIYNSESSSVLREYLKEVEGDFPYYPNPSFAKLIKKFGEFDLTQPLSDGVQVVLRKPVKLENEAIYVGEWSSKLERHGRGKQNWIDGSLYEGYWKHDRANGRGRLIHADGDVYEGEWKDDKASGIGKYIHIDASSYNGQWLEDKQHGHGVEIWPDGARYEGDYYSGRKHGKGHFVWADKSSYIGEFKDNNIHGLGIYQWGDGRRYEGTWKDNKMDGRGKFTWNDNRMYVGDYVDDKKQGFGTFTWPDGRKYEGMWLDGKQHGKGTYTNPQGQVVQGEWKFGKILTQFS